MSWTVNIIDNTLSIPERYLVAFNKQAASILEPDYNGGTFFNNEWIPDYDAREFVDSPFHNREYVELLKLYNAKGHIGFADMEGNKSKIWGYRFDGIGHLILTTGTIVWEG